MSKQSSKKIKIPPDLLKILKKAGLSPFELQSWKKTVNYSISASINYILFFQDTTLFLKRYRENAFPYNEFDTLEILTKIKGKGFYLPRIIKKQKGAEPFLLQEYLPFPSLNKKKLGVEDLNHFLIRYRLFHNSLPTKETIGPVGKWSHSWLTPNLTNPRQLFLKATFRLIKRLLIKEKNAIKELFDLLYRLSLLPDYLFPRGPFRLCHGDLTLRNIIQNKDKYYLVDWEYSFIGPAEKDLADFLADYLLLSGQKISLIKKLNLEGFSFKSILVFMIPQILTQAWIASWSNKKLDYFFKLVEKILRELGF